MSNSKFIKELKNNDLDSSVRVRVKSKKLDNILNSRIDDKLIDFQKEYFKINGSYKVQYNIQYKIDFYYRQTFDITTINQIEHKIKRSFLTVKEQLSYLIKNNNVKFFIKLFLYI